MLALYCYFGSPCNDDRHLYFLRPGWALIGTQHVLCGYQAPCIMVHFNPQGPGKQGPHLVE